MAGRKRKQGKRTKSGRLSRAGEPRFDKGTERVQQMQEEYGNFYSTALGRAYSKGLLNDPTDERRAKERYDAASKYASINRKVMGGDRYRCALDRTPVGMGGYDHDPQREADAYRWLIVNGKRIEETGCRLFFDQLTSRQYTDHGPPWLDRLFESKDRRDRMFLDAAIKAIDAIGPVQSVAISVRYSDAA